MKQGLNTILLVAFVDLVGFGLIIPLQAAYADRMGATGLTFGLLVGIYATMQIIFSPLLGRLSDRVGRRPVLLACLGGSVVSHALLGVGDLANSLVLLFVARALDGITGGNIATAQAYIADVTTEEDRAKGMGLFGAAFGVGFVVGPALGAGLVFLGGRVGGSEYATSWPAFGAAAASGLAALLVWRRLPEPRSRQTRDSRYAGLAAISSLHRRNGGRSTERLLLMLFGVTFSFVLLEVSLVYLCRSRLNVDVAGTGLVFAYFGILMVIVQGGMVGRLARRFGEANVLSLAPFLSALGFLIISGMSFDSGLNVLWLLLLVGGIPTAMGHGLAGPNINALISRQTASDQQGRKLGAAQAVGSLARATAPPIGGLLYDVSPPLPYWVGAALFLVIGVFAVCCIAGSTERPETR